MDQIIAAFDIGHLVVDLGDDDFGLFGGRFRVVTRYAEAAEALFIGSRNLYYGYVYRIDIVENLWYFVEEAGEEFTTIFRDGAARIAGHEVGEVAEVSVALWSHVFSVVQREHVVDPHVMQPFSLSHHLVGDDLGHTGGMSEHHAVAALDGFYGFGSGDDPFLVLINPIHRLSFSQSCCVLVIFLRNRIYPDRSR